MPSVVLVPSAVGNIESAEGEENLIRSQSLASTRRCHRGRASGGTGYDEGGPFFGSRRSSFPMPENLLEPFQFRIVRLIIPERNHEVELGSVPVEPSGQE